MEDPVNSLYNEANKLHLAADELREALREMNDLKRPSTGRLNYPREEYREAVALTVLAAAGLFAGIFGITYAFNQKNSFSPEHQYSIRAESEKQIRNAVEQGLLPINTRQVYDTAGQQPELESILN